MYSKRPMTLARRKALWLFLSLAVTTYTAVYFAARLPSAATRPAFIGAAGVADLTITVPLLYYSLVLRRGYSSWMALIAVSLAGARSAGVLLPLAERAWLPSTSWLGIPFEAV